MPILTEKTPELIKALRNTASKLEEEDNGYNWGYTSFCNCGLLAKELLNISHKEFEEDYLKNEISLFFINQIQANLICDASTIPWEYLAEAAFSQLNSLKKHSSGLVDEEVCPKTNIPIVDIFLILQEYGLTKQDFADLEDLTYEKIPSQFKHRDDPTAVAAYMRELATKLELQDLRNNLQQYNFNLDFKLNNPDTDPTIYEDALFEAGCSDALLGVGRKGYLGVSFIRIGHTAKDTISSGIEEVKAAIEDGELYSITSPDLDESVKETLIRKYKNV